MSSVSKKVEGKRDQLSKVYEETWADKKIKL